MKSVVSIARKAITCSYVLWSPITPTDLTGNKAANAWEMLLSSGMPMIWPRCLTSSLNSSLSGSINLSFMSSNKPPTLWWVLMVWEGPLNEIDSITSGYKVPWSNIHNGQVDSQTFVQGLFHLDGLVLSHESVIDVDSMEPVADGLLHDLGTNSGVNTSGNSTDHLGRRSNKGSNSLDLGVDEILHGPVLGGLTDLDSKVLQQSLSLKRVCHLRMELDTKDVLLGVCNTGKRRVTRNSHCFETGRKSMQFVMVRHPNLRVVDSLKQRTSRVLNSQSSWTVFSFFSTSNTFTVNPGQFLHTVTNTQDWNS
ncbi:hypothetical protein OGAPHI_006362 [Ogataea philodendri]|uniref:Uncharacterized protein n=1 Tax=Ogataea philodendri TaxID=1378263 RepID=A0A9P8NXD6_9ASCO|nr:uncharacterized protein OGAPHI_006362 [Ogataea philodendri]KAH3661515.1 hypothetical protein OGAPHI_006362 [Ogataea philodendri]